MSTSRVIDNQRFGKVSKNANNYHQVWPVNLETLFVCLWKLRRYKTRTNKSFGKKKFSEKKLKLMWFNGRETFRLSMWQFEEIELYARKEIVKWIMFPKFYFVSTCTEKNVKLPLVFWQEIFVMGRFFVRQIEMGLIQICT